MPIFLAPFLISPNCDTTCPFTGQINPFGDTPPVMLLTGVLLECDAEEV